MLILSRKVGESIKVDGKITVRLVKVGKGRVRIGIEAPPEVSVTRSDCSNSVAGDPFPTSHFRQTVTI